MGTLVFQATLGGQVNLTGPNTASTFTISVPAVTGTLGAFSSLTNNGVAYVNGSGQPTSGSALTFDGTNLGVGTGSVTTTGNFFTATTSGYFFAGAGSYSGGVYGSNSGNYANIKAPTDIVSIIGSTEGMRLTSTGLGIGTSSPAYKLDVNGEINLADNQGLRSAGALLLRRNATSHEIRIGSGDTSDYLAFYTGSFLRATLDSSGNLGLGVTPSAWGSGVYQALEMSNGTGIAAYTGTTAPVMVVNSNAYRNSSSGNFTYKVSNSATQYIQNQGVHSWQIAPSGTAGNAITFTQAMTLDASGNLLVGSTSSSFGASGRGVIEVNGSSSSVSANMVAGARAGYLFHNGTDYSVVNFKSGALIFSTNDTERARIDSSGNLLVGKTVTTTSVGVGAMMFPTGFIASTAANTLADNYNYYNTTAGAYRFYVDNGGTIHATSIVITAISDQRLKENIRDINTGLNSIMALRPRRFDWKEGKGQDKKDAAGFIAQEFETVFPECVSTSKAGEDGIEYKNINHETLIPTLVKAIQEQQAIIDSLKARLDAANL